MVLSRTLSVKKGCTDVTYFTQEVQAGVLSFCYRRLLFTYVVLISTRSKLSCDSDYDSIVFAFFRLTYIWQGDRLTGSSSPPSRKLFLSRHSPRGSTLIGNPIDCSKTICWVVISSCSSNTGGKLSAVDAFNPWCRGLMYKGCIRVVNVVNSELDVDFPMRVKYKGFKLNGVTLVLCPGWKVLKFVSSFL